MTHLTWTRALLVTAALTTTGSHLAQGDEFVPLFDGKTLDGWKKVGGGATYEIENGEIVGTVGPGANTFLRTEKTYGDFVLKLEAKWDVLGNSGIQFRSHQRPSDDGNGRVFGYQCELDPSDRAWSAGIYDEARRGWLYPLTGKEDAREAVKLDDWNDIKIRAVGPHLQTYMNGVPCADLIDTADLEGFIALQVHSGKAGQIRWRNIRIKDMGTSEWKPLWNGKDLTGWRKIGDGTWTIENGVLHGRAENTEQFGHLITDKKYSDFALRLKFKSNKGNSGVYFRVDESGPLGVEGFQAEVDPENYVGGLYESNGRKWVSQPKPEDVRKYFQPGEWNTMAIVALDDRIVVQVNDKTSAELLSDPGRREGYIALQVHSKQDVDVEFKDIQFLDLTDQ